MDVLNFKIRSRAFSKCFASLLKLVSLVLNELLVLYNTLHSYTNVIIESSIYADKLNYEKYLVKKQN